MIWTKTEPGVFPSNAAVGYNNGMAKAIDVGDLPEPLIDAIESLVKTYRLKAGSVVGPSQAVRPIGWLKGKWELPDTFFEPLPDDLLDLFNGGGARE